MTKITNQKTKIIPLSRLVVKDAEEIDTVKCQQRRHDHNSLNVLFQAMQYWSTLDIFRKDRERNKKYCYGDQWSDRVPNGWGGWIKEEEFIKQQGSIPLKNNLIRRLVNSVCGVYLSQDKIPVCKARDRDEQKLGETMSTALECNWALNNMAELNSLSFEEFLISGAVIHRKCCEWRGDKRDCYTDYVNPNYFFIDSNVRRPDGKDAVCVGEIHDIPFIELCQKFAHSGDDFFKLKQIYGNQSNIDQQGIIANQFGYERLSSYDFFTSKDPALCRVIEVWRKESKPRYRCVDYLNGEMFKCEIADYKELVEIVNTERLADGLEQGLAEDEIPLIEAEWCIDTYWYYRYLTPFGDILDEGESPYDHKEHPYVMKFYPFIDGEIHSFVADVIDQQRYVNRLITLYDWIMRTSAKGVCFAPDDILPADMSWEDFAYEIQKSNGLVRYKVKPHGKVPQIVSANSTNIGIGDLLNIQLKFFEDISGVNGALQGKSGFSNISGVLYAQQTQNATTSLVKMLTSFSSFVCDCAKKDVKNIQQYYDTKKILNIAGRNASIMYDPDKIQDVDYDISIAEAQASPTHRMAANEFLLQIWQSGQISLQQLLENGDFPFADRLLESIKAQQETLAQQQQMLGAMQGSDVNAQQMANSVEQKPIPAELIQQAQAYANRDNVLKGERMINKAASVA